jgi:hypothetical protein
MLDQVAVKFKATSKVMADVAHRRLGDVFVQVVPVHRVGAGVDHGADSIGGRPYRMVEVIFEQEGGGRDWEDRFVYWFGEEDGMLDFLAYDFGDGGTRFREAFNRREIEGILFQDYRNYTADEVTALHDYSTLFDRGQLTLVSTIELENVEVRVLQGEGRDVSRSFNTATEAPGVGDFS